MFGIHSYEDIERVRQDFQDKEVGCITGVPRLPFELWPEWRNFVEEAQAWVVATQHDRFAAWPYCDVDNEAHCMAILSWFILEPEVEGSPYMKVVHGRYEINRQRVPGAFVGEHDPKPWSCDQYMYAKIYSAMLNDYSDHPRVEL